MSRIPQFAVKNFTIHLFMQLGCGYIYQREHDFGIWSIECSDDAEKPLNWKRMLVTTLQLRSCQIRRVM